MHKTETIKYFKTKCMAMKGEMMEEGRLGFSGHTAIYKTNN